MWITAAGIVVEFVLAGLATYVWAFTESKTIINQFALNVMVVASVNTILFNGNPLLRYDGYFFLMDLMEMPNLKQKGSGYLWYLLQRFVLGVENAPEPIDVRGREPAVLGYALCSGVYRWFVMVAITTMVWRFLDPYGWGVIGGVMAIGCLYNAILGPLVKFAKFVFSQRHRLHVRLATAVALVLLIGASGYGIMAVPVEQSIEAQCVLRPKHQRLSQIYVGQGGFLLEQPGGRFVTDGEVVEANEVLLQLTDEQLTHQVADLRIQILQLRTRKRQVIERGDLGTAAQIEAEMKGLSGQYERARHNLDKLTIRAPRAGVVELLTDVQLKNLQGRWVPLQSPLFAIYEAGQFEAVVAINHRDIGTVKLQQKAQIKLWALDDEQFESEVETKPPTPVQSMSSAAFSTALGGEVPTMPAASETQALKPAENTYEVALPINQYAPELRDGMVGRAKIIVERRTLGRAAYIWLIRTLRQDIRL